MPPSPLLLLALLAASAAALSTRTVRTKYGAVSGSIVTPGGGSRRLEAVEAFRGVPYASPPTGRLRFMPPVTGARWGGVRAADRPAPACPQRLPDVANETAALRTMPRGRLQYLRRLLPYLRDQSEDCLYLNIYAPAQGAVVTLDTVSTHVRQAEEAGFNGGRTSLYKILLNMGFKWDRTNGRRALLDEPRISEWRTRFLRAYRRYMKEGFVFIFMDETWFYSKAGSRDTAGPKYPVMVFIHGESYEWNSGNPYDGSVLASYGSLVVITVNYRLGALGFLNANTETRQRAPSNYGLMDQVAALHWVQENIAAFGGDPSNVTVVGHGTGAACLHFLMASSAVPDGLLFHRAVLMSGSALSPWSLVRSPARHAAQVARHAGCPAHLPHAQLLRCLRERPVHLLVAAPVRAPAYSPAFGPSVDGVVVDVGEPPGSGAHPLPRSEASGSPGTTGSALLDGVMLRKSALSRVSRYQLLLGVSRAEAYPSFSADDVQYGLEPGRRSELLKGYVQAAYRYHQPEILATVVNEYTDWERPVQHPVGIRDETMEALGDAQVVAPVVRTADMHAASGRRRPYLYVFEYQTKYGDYPQRQGCVHGEDLAYLFGAPLVGGFNHFPRNYTKAEMLLSEITMAYWSNFAWAGNPSEPSEAEPHGGGHHGKPRLKTVEWPAYEAVHKKYISLDLKPRVKSHYRAHRLSFWLNLVPDLHRSGDDVPASHHLLDHRDHHPGSPPPTPPRPQPPPAADNVTATPAPAAAQSPRAASNATVTPATRHPQDGFADYSTALSLTVAIGCSLLVLNVLVFAGVYYRRDKPPPPPHHRPHRAGDGAASPQPPPDKNGRIPNSVASHHRHLYPLVEYPGPARPVPPPTPPPRAPSPAEEEEEAGAPGDDTDRTGL